MLVYMAWSSMPIKSKLGIESDWQMNDTWKLRTGLQWREANFKSKNSGILAAQTATQNLPAGVTLADITTTIDDLDDLFGSGAPASWVKVDSKKWRETFNYPDAFNFCNIECGAGRSHKMCGESATGRSYS